MNQSFLANFSQQVADLFPYAGTKDFSEKLADMFKCLVDTDNIMIILFPSKKLPIIEYNDHIGDPRKSVVDKYVKGAFLLDPFYLAAREKKDSRFLHLKEAAPDAFEDSEYFNSYYKDSCLSDECGYIIHFGDDGEKFLIIGLGQVETEADFNREQLTQLAEITPLIEAITNYHWQLYTNESEHHLDVREQLETALDCFGTSILTDRENQTVKMILQGYSSKAIAERFNISVETIKLHRKNAYAKLDLGTQGELFNLFINSLMNIENYVGGDPLIEYHSPG